MKKKSKISAKKFITKIKENTGADLAQNNDFMRYDQIPDGEVAFENFGKNTLDKTE